MDIDVTSLTNRRADKRWDRVCVADLVERLTWSVPDQPAIIGWEGAYSDPRFSRLSFKELDALANRIANGLLATGLERGDRVLLACENSVEGYAFKLGAAKIGVVVFPLNPAYAPDVIAYLVGQIEPRFSVVDAELWGQVQDGFDRAGLSPDVTIEIGGGLVRDSLGFTAFVDAQPDTEPQATIHGDDIFEILPTSGTTSMPKGVMLSHTSATFAAHGFALTVSRGVPFEGNVVLAAFLPMMYHIGHHIFALAAFAAGGTFVLGRRLDPHALASAIEQESVTAVWGGSPAMLSAVLGDAEAHDHDLNSLTVAVYGWAALPPAVLDGYKVRAPHMSPVAIFGQTESISCHRFWPDKWDEVYRATAPRTNYVGLPSPLLANQIVDALGEPLVGQPGVVGEAVYRSPVMTAGYYRNPEATQEAFRDGWFHSGDSCMYDEQGLRIMVDRFKDIVKSGGENVSSLRVESVLVQHPMVAKAAVIGMPDDRWGEAVTAVVVPTDPSVDESDIITFAREHLAGYETPKRVIFVDALPETVGGKIMKFKLRQQYGR